MLYSIKGDCEQHMYKILNKNKVKNVYVQFLYKICNNFVNGGGVNERIGFYLPGGSGRVL